jgi:3-oxoacyl-[acyl-carrier-protein] synthase III
VQWNGIYVSSSAAYLGRTVEDVRDAVAEGRYDAQECKLDGYLHVRVSENNESPAEMAVAAAKRALDRAQAGHENIVFVIHGGSGAQGLYYWPTASYIQRETVAGTAYALEVKQASNSGMAALELAAAYLLTKPAPSAALVTTADSYNMPHFDRYRSERGQPRGDGASAIVLSHGNAEGAVAKLLSTASAGESTHERMYRGDQPWEKVPGANGWPANLRIRIKEYLRRGARVEDIVATLASNQHKVIDSALGEAGIGIDEVARFVFPNTGLTVVNWEARKRDYGIDVIKSTWEWGRHIGHMGGTDQAAGFTYLLESRSVQPGDYVLLTGTGAGFSFSAAVLEVLRLPEWDSSTGVEEVTGRAGRP